MTESGDLGITNLKDFDNVFLILYSCKIFEFLFNIIFIGMENMINKTRNLSEEGGKGAWGSRARFLMFVMLDFIVGVSVVIFYFTNYL